MSNEVVDIELRERVATLEQLGRANTARIGKHDEKIDKLESDFNAIHRIDTLLELQIKALDNQNRIIGELEKTTSKLEYTVSNINTNITYLNESQKELRDTVTDLEKQMTSKREAIEDTKKDKKDSNWGKFDLVDFMTNKALPAVLMIIIGMVLSYIGLKN